MWSETLEFKALTLPNYVILDKLPNLSDSQSLQVSNKTKLMKTELTELVQGKGEGEGRGGEETELSELLV